MAPNPCLKKLNFNSALHAITSNSGLSGNDLKKLMKDRKKVALIAYSRRGNERMFKDKPLLRECCLVHPEISSGVLETRRNLYHLQYRSRFIKMLGGHRS